MDPAIAEIVRGLAYADALRDFRAAKASVGEMTMFEVGKKYWFETGMAEDPGTSVYTVTAVDLPLVQLQGGEGIVILNTHSPLFHNAKPFKEVRWQGDGPAD